jgi:subtilisin family serine protease
MFAYNPQADKAAEHSTETPSEELRVAITFPPASGAAGPTKLDTPLTAPAIKSLAPSGVAVDKALHELTRRGFKICGRGHYAATARIARAKYEELFGTKLEVWRVGEGAPYRPRAFYFPPKQAAWNPDAQIMSVIDDAYIQWPHIYMARKAGVKRPRRRKKTGRPAPVITAPDPGYYHLNAPLDLRRLLNVDQVHRKGITGKGVRIAMIDSGFGHDHPFFTSQGFKSTVVLAPGATNRATDRNGHGTGESANIFSVAPNVDFIGVKVDDDNDPNGGASVLDGFIEAMKHGPKVISVSLGYDLRDNQTGGPLNFLPNNLKGLAAEIQNAVTQGVVVVFSAGNGHYSFPGMLPEVISAGGVFVDEAGAMQASDYASAFPSLVYPGRNVPDFCGLVGLLPHADYILLPIPAGCEIDRENAAHDGTGPNDSWGVFSGTSAAAPQIAGLCALLLEANPGLTPGDVKSLLQRSARDVSAGHANQFSDANGVGVAAGPGPDGATGSGLVDAAAAVALA